MLGLPYEVSSCSMTEQMLIDELHLIMLGVLETLNWSAMLLLSMQKHALMMFTKER